MIVEEGSATIDVPGNPVQKGPGTKRAGFFNSSQRLNRDLTLSFLAAVRPSHALDAFGGTGVRGIRISKELGIEATISEINPASCRVIEKNAELSKAEVSLYNESFEKTLERKLFDYIDVDPYGSVVPYADKAVTSVKNGGYVAFTATDLSALTGSVPAKTLRRYQAFIQTDSFKHEMGVRLLISYVVRRAAAYDLAATPLLSFWYSHFYRVIFRIERGASKSDHSVNQIGFVNKNNLLGGIYDDVDEGPVWTGNLQSSSILEKISSQKMEHVKETSDRYAHILRSEDKSLLFVELTDIARSVRSNIPKISDLVEFLEKKSISSVRTHFSPTGLKTEGDPSEVYSLISEHMRDNYKQV